MGGACTIKKAYMTLSSCQIQSSTIQLKAQACFLSHDVVVWTDNGWIAADNRLFVFFLFFISWQLKCPIIPFFSCLSNHKSLSLSYILGPTCLLNSRFLILARFARSMCLGLVIIPDLHAQVYQTCTSISVKPTHESKKLNIF